jgi:carboxymethylenebutenolidase
MPTFTDTITTADGRCPVTLAVPDGAGPWPAVVMYPDAGGARPVFREMAQRLAATGYVVLVPDVYYRYGDWVPFEMRTAFSDAAEVTGARFGTTGYCMGGRTSLTVASRVPDRVAAAMSFHGGGLADPDDPTSPHWSADAIKAAVYVGGAENDPSYTEADEQRLDAALTEAGVVHTLEWYPAAHGFAVADNGPYDPAAAERHWQAMASFFAEHLPR